MAKRSSRIRFSVRIERKIFKMSLPELGPVEIAALEIKREYKVREISLFVVALDENTVRKCGKVQIDLGFFILPERYDSGIERLLSGKSLNFDSLYVRIIGHDLVTGYNINFIEKRNGSIVFSTEPSLAKDINAIGQPVRKITMYESKSPLSDHKSVKCGQVGDLELGKKYKILRLHTFKRTAKRMCGKVGISTILDGGVQVELPDRFKQIAEYIKRKQPRPENVFLSYVGRGKLNSYLIDFYEEDKLIDPH